MALILIARTLLTLPAQAVIALLIGMQAAQAVPINSTWIGPVSGGSWETASNWNPGGVPGSNAANTYDVNVNDGASAVSFVSSTATTINSLAIAAGNKVNILNNGTGLRFNGGPTSTSVINGTLALGSTGGTTQLSVVGTGVVKLSGSGELALSNNVANRVIKASGAGNTASLGIDAGFTVHGAGLLGVGSLKIDNQGTIRADTSAGLTLQIIGSAAAPVTSTNKGVLEANGGRLTISAEVMNATLDNTGGALWANNGSTIALTGTGGTLVVKGGDFRTTGSGIVTAASTTLSNGATIASGIDFRVNNAASVSLAAGATYTIDGKMSLNASGTGGNNTLLTLTGTGTTTLAGTGELVLSNNTKNRVTTNNGPNLTLVNGEGFTIRGSGIFGNVSNGMPNIDNRGTLRAEGSAGLLLGLVGGSGANTIANSGVLAAKSGSTLTIAGGTVNNTATGMLQTEAGSLMDITGTLANYNAAARTLTGGIYRALGEIRFANADIVTNRADVLLDGTGSIKNRAATPVSAFRNFATNDTAGRFTLDHGATLNTPGNFTNRGVLTVGEASQFQVNSGNGTLTQTGGSTIVDGTVKAALLDVRGGTLAGTGTVQGSATIAAGASVGPGNSPGKLSFTGNFTLANDADYDVELAGAGAGEYDVIDVAGTATLADGADIDVTLLDAYDPQVGSFFDVFLAGTLLADLGTIDFLYPTFGDGRYFVASIVDLANGRDALRLTVERTLIGQGVPAPGALALFLLAAGAGILVRRRRT